MEYDIHKAGGVLLSNKRFLVARSKGKDIFVAPGGKLEADETPEQALQRELREELGIDVSLDALSPFGTFYADAAGETGARLRMDVFLVSNWQRDIAPAHEVEEVRWIDSGDSLKLGSIFEHEVLPRLKQKALID